jgi:hypothetical protein
LTQEPGATLDRLIELRVFGRKPVTDVPPYSTSDPAADMVVRALARPPWRWMCLRSGQDWTFHWRQPMANRDLDSSTITRYVTLIMVTAPTRPLAICRAALKLLGPIGGDADSRRKSRDAPNEPAPSSAAGKPAD